MSAPLTLLHCRPDALALTTWANRHRLLSPDGDDGYALHALLASAFGALAPKPFRHLGGARGLLGYSAAAPDALREAAALAPPDLARALGLDDLAARPFPTTWRAGQPLAFEVRVRPVVRCKAGGERDAFLHALARADVAPAGLRVGAGPVESGPVPLAALAERLPPTPVALPGREAVYRDWLAAQLARDGAAELLNAGMDGFRLSRVLRQGAASADGGRATRRFMGPDASFSGQLRIRDPATFAALVARGLGRHRAFGFGMLLLRPGVPC